MFVFRVFSLLRPWRFGLTLSVFREKYSRFSFFFFRWKRCNLSLRTSSRRVRKKNVGERETEELGERSDRSTGSLFAGQCNLDLSISMALWLFVQVVGNNCKLAWSFMSTGPGIKLDYFRGIRSSSTIDGVSVKRQGRDLFLCLFLIIIYYSILFYFISFFGAKRVFF